MKTVLIIHGIGGHAGIHWQQWLHDELKRRGHSVLMPDLPSPNHPDRQTWLHSVQTAVNGADPGGLVIVGHSLGVTMALDFIEQSTGPIDGLVSVSGFAADYGSDLNGYFLKERLIDFKKVRESLDWSAVIYGDNDPYVTQEALRHVADSLGVSPVVVHDGGHLNTEAGYTEFPELLRILKDKLKD